MAFLPIQNYSYQPPLSQKPISQQEQSQLEPNLQVIDDLTPQPRTPTQSLNVTSPRPGYQSQYSMSMAPSSQTTPPMTFQSTQMAMPRRQSVNDLGAFGGQAGAVNAKLAALLDPSYQDVRTTDRDIAGLVQAIDRTGQQTARMGQAAAAERAAAEGTLQGGGFANEAQQIFEQARQTSGDQIAGVVAQKSSERQGQIMQALQLGAGLIDSQQKMNLERELADLQNAQDWNKTSLQRDLGFGDLNLRSALGFGDLDAKNRGLDIQHQLGMGDLSLRERLGMRGLDLQELGLENNNNQFYDRLGFDRGQFEALMNQNMMSQLGGY